MAPEVERKIIEQCYRENRPLPKGILEQPELRFGLELYLDAFYDLSSCRQIGMGLAPIPWSAIKDYSVAYDLDDEQEENLFYFTRHLDSAFLEHHKSNDKTKTSSPPKHGKFK